MLEVDRNLQIVPNHDLIKGIVYSIDKAIGDDTQQYLREHHRETNNALILLRGDFINTNLRNYVVNGDIDFVPFKRYGWSGRIVIDRKECITYSIITEGTLSAVPKKKNRETPHYLQSILYAENKECIARERQMTLEDFGITIFDTDVLEEDFEKISQGMINVEEGYRHYIVAYVAENGEIKDINLKFLDKDFNIVDETSLMQFIKPDFAQLTNVGPTEDGDEATKSDRRGLVTIKDGVKPKLRKIEKKA